MTHSASPAVRVLEGDSEACGPLFLDAAFNRFQARVQGKRLLEVSLADPGTGESVRLTLGGRDGEWTSPVTGAFGGLTFEGAPPSPAAADRLLVEVADRLRDEGARRVTIRLRPDGLHDPAGPALENAMFRAGWRLVEVDLNAHITVSEPQAWLASLGETRRKELRRLERSGATFVRGVAGAQVHEVIAENRAARGYPMTMSWPQVEALAEAFPDRVGFFAVLSEARILAGAIRLQVSQACDYVFYWGETTLDRRRSPVVQLAQGLVADAHARGVAILDLGVSTDRSTPNSGLIAFKESLGAVLSARRTWVLDLV